MDLNSFLNRVERVLGYLLSDKKLTARRLEKMETPNPLAEGMRYAVLGAGKRIRPTAVYLGADAVGFDFENITSNEYAALSFVAAEIELVHSYSLVHDDLPAMDNDDVRRGKPSVHKAFGEANAILIGDMLLNKAAMVRSMLTELSKEADSAARYSIGAAYEMAVGQAMDISFASGQPVTEEEYLRCCSLKTGALIRAAFMAGARIGGGNNLALAIIKDYANSLGIIFQLTDDLLDSGKELSLVTIAGEERVRAIVKSEGAKAYAAANKLPNPAPLIDFIKTISERNN